MIRTLITAWAAMLIAGILRHQGWSWVPPLGLFHTLLVVAFVTFVRHRPRRRSRRRRALSWRRYGTGLVIAAIGTALLVSARGDLLVGLGYASAVVASIGVAHLFSPLFGPWRVGSAPALSTRGSHPPTPGSVP